MRALPKRWIPAAGLSALAIAAAGPAAAETVQVRAGRLVDPGRGEVLADQLVTVVDGRVAAVGPWRGPPAEGRLVDWSGYWVLPGLIDMHTHVADGWGQTSDPAEPIKHSAEEQAAKAAEAARATLMAGFTSVRDVGVYRGLADVALRDAIAAGKVIGPRMTVAGGYVTRPGGGGAVTGAPAGTVIPPQFRLGEASNPEEARAAVRRLVGGGADFIKIIATGAVLAVGSEPGELELDEPTLKAACEEAARLGSYCIAHAHGAAGIRAALRAGARSIEHASLIDDEGIALAKATGAFLDMDIYNGDYIDEVGRREGWPAEYLRKNLETTEAQRQGFSRAFKAGARISYGTDAGVYPHGWNGRQFAYMVRWGMTPMQAIRSATTEAAVLLGRSAEVGSLCLGCYGDMIAVAQDPSKDVTALARVAGVIKGGTVAKAP